MQQLLVLRRPQYRDDPDRFREWVEPHLGKMYRLAARMNSEADAADVVQESLVRAWTKRHLYQPDKGPAGPWLLAITADQARRARRRSSHALVLVDAPGPRAVEDGLDLEAAIRQLSPRQRLAVDCYYFVDLSTRETAAVMSCSEGTVKSTLADARAALRRQLGEER